MKRPSGDSPQHKWLTIDDFEYLCFDFTREYLSFDEPIPDYSTRNNSLLESALGSPRQTFNNKLLYPTLVKQAAILFYSLIKNHPFENGNKRIAVMSMLTFLALNGKWLSISPFKLYLLACRVAESYPRDREKLISSIETILKMNIVKFPTKPA